MMKKYAETEYGFEYGSMSVERLISDEKWGVIVSLKSKHTNVELRATPGGRIIIHKWIEK